MPLDDLEQKHLEEYKGYLDRLTLIKPENGESYIKYDKNQLNAIQYRIEVVSGLIQSLETKRDEP